ncbi:hypothetical protein CCMA1212_008088 [Trichoderma ghanense]|uniref:Uncharacterized protein n=1 Tax=Trichoderma ghanense TaxID=65468 RepID=A0ABY2GXD0_9HYPO
MGVRGEDRQADGQMGGRTDECHVAASGVASSLSTRQSCADDDDDDNDDAGTTTTLAFALGRGRRGVRLNMWPSRLSTPPHQRPLHLLLCKLQSPRGPIARDILAAWRLQGPRQPFIFNGEDHRPSAAPPLLGILGDSGCLDCQEQTPSARPRTQSPPRPDRPGAGESHRMLGCYGTG